MAPRLPDSLTVRGGRLFVEDCDSVALADRFGSPIFVFSGRDVVPERLSRTAEVGS